MSRPAAPPANLHACAVVVGETGILIRGASGAGKTRLALALVAEAGTRGLFARLVADDRVLVARHGGRLVARPHPLLAGLAERRGFGIVALAHEPACVLGLAVDLSPEPPARLPSREAGATAVAGIPLPRLALAAAAPVAEAVGLVLAALGAGPEGPAGDGVSPAPPFTAGS